MSIVCPSSENLAGMRLADAGNRFQQFGLAVAGDTGNADDLAGADIEGDVVDHDDAAVVLDREVADRQHDLAGIGLALLNAQQDAAANHQLGQLLDRCLGGLAGRHHLAAAHDGDRVGDRHDLAQLVGDQDDGLALVAQDAEDVEQMIGFSRRQHARRLVENKDLGAAIHGLEDFHALLQADRKLLRSAHPD